MRAETSPNRYPEHVAIVASARVFGLVFGGLVIAASGALRGTRGLAAAAIGVAVSLINLWVMSRFANRAARQVATEGAHSAVSGLLGGMAAKTVVLLIAAGLLSRVAGAELVPFTFGLLISVAALLAAPLWSERNS